MPNFSKINVISIAKIRQPTNMLSMLSATLLAIFSSIFLLFYPWIGWDSTSTILRPIHSTTGTATALPSIL